MFCGSLAPGIGMNEPKVPSGLTTAICMRTTPARVVVAYSRLPSGLSCGLRSYAVVLTPATGRMFPKGSATFARDAWKMS